MTTTTPPTVADTLKYANLQMAAEAFLIEDNGNPKVGQRYKDALVAGNGHASKFTATQAGDFVTHWRVVDQRDDTTGFSGTLFECVLDDPATGAKKGELVISLRSTEFIDDAARDNVATNALEISKTGFAFGQIRDMERWYANLQSSGKLPPGHSVNVTGYSLGGHLATVFNILHQANISQVVTFNGAGIGGVDTQQTLSSGACQWPDVAHGVLFRAVLASATPWIRPISQQSLTCRETTY